MARPITTSSRNSPLNPSSSSSKPSSGPRVKEVRVPVPGPPGPPGTVLGLIAVESEPSTPPPGYAHIWFDGTDLKIKKDDGTVLVFATVAE